MPTWDMGCVFPEDVLPVASKELVLCLWLYSLSLVSVRVTSCFSSPGRWCLPVESAGAVDEPCSLKPLRYWCLLLLGVSGGFLPPCLVPLMCHGCGAAA